MADILLPVQCPATLTNMSALKQKHKDQPGVEFTVKKQQKSQSGQAIKQTQTEMSKAYTDFHC